MSGERKEIRGKHEMRLVGLVGDASFQMGRTMLREIEEKYSAHVDMSVEIEGLLELDWRHFIHTVILDQKGHMWMFKENAVLFHNGEVVGGVEEAGEKFLSDLFSYSNCRPLELFQAMAEEAYRSHFALNTPERDVVYFDVTINNEKSGRLLIELFSDKCPKTCYNFKCLCTGEKGRSEQSGLKLHYQGSLLHRVVKNGWVQGGDIDIGKGNGGCSIYDTDGTGQFEDESFAVKFDKRGILAMANHGRHTNRSQFFITFQACPWMEKKYVAFGRVVEGFDVLNALESQETFNERPKKDCVIESCGVFYDAAEAARLAAAKEEERKELARQLASRGRSEDKPSEEIQQVQDDANAEDNTTAPTTEALPASSEQTKSIDDTLEQVAESAANLIV